MSEVAIKTIHEDLIEIKERIGKIDNILEEDYELSDFAKKELKKARAEEKSISHKELMKNYASDNKYFLINLCLHHKVF